MNLEKQATTDLTLTLLTLFFVAFCDFVFLRVVACFSDFYPTPSPGGGMFLKIRVRRVLQGLLCGKCSSAWSKPACRAPGGG